MSIASNNSSTPSSTHFSPKKDKDRFNEVSEEQSKTSTQTVEQQCPQMNPDISASIYPISQENKAATSLLTQKYNNVIEKMKKMTTHTSLKKKPFQDTNQQEFDTNSRISANPEVQKLERTSNEDVTNFAPADCPGCHYLRHDNQHFMTRQL